MKTFLIGLCTFMTSISLLGSTVQAFANEQPHVKNVVILLGPPGSGKGTQAVRLSKELNIPHISTGDLFRENLGKGTDLGKKAKSFMEAGKLVPDELVLEMLFDRVSRKDCANGYLLDGFPRTIPQAEAFAKHLDKNSKIIVLNLAVDDDIIVKRVAGRLTCKSCGNIHNQYFSAPLSEGFCDKCNGELIQRPDDAAPIVKERLRVYHEQTEPLIDFYAKREGVINVNGANAPDVVFKELMDKLKPDFQQSSLK